MPKLLSMLTPATFLARKLNELQADSHRERTNPALTDSLKTTRIYSRIKMTCGVLDTLTELNLHHLTEPQQTAYQHLRKQAFTILTAETTAKPQALCDLIDTFIEVVRPADLI